MVPLWVVPLRHRQEVFENTPEKGTTMKNVDGPAVRLVDETGERLTELLPDVLAIELGQIAALCREGLMALSVEAGLAAARAIMAEEADALCGTWNARDPERSHVRGGTTPSSVVMGGQRLAIKRPRVHGVDGDGANAGEVALETFGVFADGDVLQRTVMERMLAGVATRSYERVADPIGTQARSQATSTSKSAVSRRFVCGTQKALADLLARDLTELDAAVLMIDGVDFAGFTCVVALIVTADGTKVPVGLRLGDTENKILVKALLADLVDRGLDYSGGLLVVVDGAKALATAVRAVFGELALIQRCQIHKRRNVGDHLPKADREQVDARLRGAFADPDPHSGLLKAKRLAAKLDRTCPDAAGSLREGLEELFTVRRLGIDGTLARTLVCTNMIESMISIARTTTRNVKRWRDEGDMRRRWCTPGWPKPKANSGESAATSRCPNSSPRSAVTPTLSPRPAILNPTNSLHEHQDHPPQQLQQSTGHPPPNASRSSPRLIWWNETLNVSNRTSCGSPTSPSTAPAKASLDCAVVLDTFSRRVVGWSIDAAQTATLATNALSMAIENRSPNPRSGLGIHSDHGAQTPRSL